MKISLIIMFVLIILAGGIPWFIKPERMNGVIIDAETEEPLEGAIVLVSWQLSGWEGENGPIVKILEAKTNANGEFVFQNRWPSLYFTGLLTLYSISHIQPTTVIFKPDYLPILLSNWDYGKYSPANDKYHLQKYSGTKQEYADQISFFVSRVKSIGWGLGCPWVGESYIFNVFSDLREEYIASGVDTDLPTLWCE